MKNQSYMAKLIKLKVIIKKVVIEFNNKQNK